MNYRLTQSNAVMRLDDGAIIPPDPANVDYAQYLAWVAEDNEPESASEPEPAPEPTPAEKLAAAGLTVDELKQLLGI